MHLVGILAIALIVLIIVLMTGQKSGYKTAKLATDKQENREEFGDVLGALGPYEAQISAAINQTSQSDPSKRLQPWPAYNAGSYIQSTFTKMRQQGIPAQEPITITSKCKKQCKSNDPLASQKCEGLCVTQASVKRWCEIQCAYTDDPFDQCLRGCMDIKMVNGVSSTWVFYDH